MKQQKGFTLIELVVVIIILGVLAVTAAPKFINLQDDAKVSALSGAKGALQSANNLVHAKYQIEKANGTHNGTDVDGIPVSSSGYVNVTSSAVAAAISIDSGEWAVAPVDTTVVVAPKGATPAANCGFSYALDTSDGTPVYGDVDISDC
ncbi:type IV pilin protein [Paraferrimonas sedimenticola]|uniref:Pilin structural protein V10 n=1 Tax=Paraferrimonas sedimenticola TaxID=375674 RepID=A0AA37RYP3_9GAMM|nr:type II secretion system protein [Paraferrimonas sedimenticola]GLP97379.1 pilin structural protein V10 [Paraferrimonas sedimenticola]